MHSASLIGSLATSKLATSPWLEYLQAELKLDDGGTVGDSTPIALSDWSDLVRALDHGEVPGQ